VAKTTAIYVEFLRDATCQKLSKSANVSRMELLKKVAPRFLRHDVRILIIDRLIDWLYSGVLCRYAVGGRVLVLETLFAGGRLAAIHTSDASSRRPAVTSPVSIPTPRLTEIFRPGVLFPAWLGVGVAPVVDAVRRRNDSPQFAQRGRRRFLVRDVTGRWRHVGYDVTTWPPPAVTPTSAANDSASRSRRPSQTSLR